MICVIRFNPTRQEPGEAVGSIGVNGEGNPKFPKGIKVFLFAVHPNRLCGIIQRPLIKHKNSPKKNCRISDWGELGTKNQPT